MSPARQPGIDQGEFDAEVARRRELEERFWRTSDVARADVDSLENFFNKMREAAIFFDLIGRYRAFFAEARSILELGAGQAWASCVVKRVFPHAVVTASDLSEAAIASLGKWERVFGVEVDRARYYPSDQLDEADGTFDLVFCFAAAHHFVRHRRTLEELRRVLRPGGHALYLYEPACPSFLHTLARWRVTRRRPEVPEDVLKHDQIRALAAEVGLECHVDFYPRAPTRTVYYAVLARLPPLQAVSPCTANFRFRKPD